MMLNETYFNVLINEIALWELILIFDVNKLFNYFKVLNPMNTLNINFYLNHIISERTSLFEIIRTILMLIWDID